MQFYLQNIAINLQIIKGTSVQRLKLSIFVLKLVAWNDLRSSRTISDIADCNRSMVPSL